jgi:polysaccharide biosynthesis/export protein
MIRILNIIPFIAISFFINACTHLLEPVQLQLSEQSLSQELDQDIFKVVVKPLTVAEAKKSRRAVYNRNVMVNGSGAKANVYKEQTFINSNLPPSNQPAEYLIGIGDELTFVVQEEEYVGNTISTTSISSNSDNINSILTESTSMVGSDGSILLLGLGRLQAENRSINDIREEARNILIRNGLAPSFQLEITGFNSRKATIFGPNGSKIIPIKSQNVTLYELIADFDFGVNNKFVNLITIKRNENIYKLTTEQLLEKNYKNLFIKDKDQITIEKFEYKPGNVYSLGAGASTNIIPISPQIRETMADILFVPNGALANINAKRSEVYLLRGSAPIIAYHLDAQNVSQVLIASNMELRPNDVLFVAERSIISFTRLLQEITPLRILLRDIRDNNIP